MELGRIVWHVMVLDLSGDLIEDETNIIILVVMVLVVLLVLD